MAIANTSRSQRHGTFDQYSASVAQATNKKRTRNPSAAASQAKGFTSQEVEEEPDRDLVYVIVRSNQSLRYRDVGRKRVDRGRFLNLTLTRLASFVHPKLHILSLHAPAASTWSEPPTIGIQHNIGRNCSFCHASAESHGPRLLINPASYQGIASAMP